MGFTSTFYGQGQFSYTASYEGSTYTTQAYTQPPQYKPALSMTTQFDDSISGNTVPLAVYSNTMFTGEAVGLWVYKLYLNGQLVGTYQMSDQQFCISATFDRVEGFCLGVPLTPSEAEASTTTLVPAPASLTLIMAAGIAALFGKRKK
jgi:hypothetical protein